MKNRRMVSYEGYLDETKLGQCLSEIFPEHTFVYNRAVPGSGISNRPDYRCEELKLIVEFDGYQHYCQVDIMHKDMLKDCIYESMGYRIVRIPYYIQLTTDVVEHLFGVSDVEMKVEFPHGFIVDKGEKLPAEFCSLGIIRFAREMEEFAFLQETIVDTLKAKMGKHQGCIAHVLPMDCTNAIKSINLMVLGMESVPDAE